MRLPFLTFTSLALFACGGNSDDGSTDASNTPPVVTIDTLDDNVLPELALTALTATASDAEDGDLPLVWSQTAGPQVDFQESEGRITFTLPKVQGEATLAFRATAVDSKGASGSDEIEITASEHPGEITVGGQSGVLFISHWDDAPDFHVYRRNTRDETPVPVHDELEPLPVDSGAALSGYNLLTLGLKLSPDHSLVAYRSDRDGDFEYELYVAAVDGSGEHLVASGMNFGTYEWSPNSRLLAFRKRPDDVIELKVVALDENGAVISDPVDISGDSQAIDPATGSATGGVYNFAWHPDGDRLVFRGELDTTGVYELWQVMLDPETGAALGERQKLSGIINPHGSGEPIGVRHFEIAPGGQHVAYRADKQTPELREMYVTPLDPSGDTVKVSGQYTGEWQDKSGNTHYGLVRDFAWSANGRLLAFRGDIVTGTKNELFTVAIPESGEPGPRHTVNGPEMTGSLVNRYTWSPTENRLAYTVDTQPDFHLYVARIAEDGSITDRKAGTPLATDNTFALEPAWSPDGSSLAISGHLNEAARHIFIANLDETGMPNGTVHRVSHEVSNPTGGFFHYEWSPDSRWIAYNGDPVHEGVNELFLVNVDDAEHPAHLNPTGDITVTDGDESNGTVDGEMRNSSFWTLHNEAIYKWAPDGSEIYFQGDLDRNNVLELYAFPVGRDASTATRRTVSRSNGMADGEMSPFMDVEDGVIEFIVTGPLP